MTDLLAAFIEWLAVLAMSLVGIEYTPAVDCDPQQPAEYGTVAYVADGYLQPASYQIHDAAVIETGLQAVTDCDASALIRPAGDTLLLVRNTRSYDS